METIPKAYITLKKSTAYFQTWQWYYRGTKNILKAGVYFNNIKDANTWLNKNYNVV